MCTLAVLQVLSKALRLANAIACFGSATQMQAYAEGGGFRGLHVVADCASHADAKVRLVRAQHPSLQAVSLIAFGATLTQRLVSGASDRGARNGQLCEQARSIP